MSRIRIKTIAIAASKQVFVSSMVVLLLAAAATPWAQAQTYKVLHQFHGKADGDYPVAGVIRDAAGNLYSTTSSGGTYDYGVVFKVDTTGKETVLYNFTGGADGAYPYAGVVLDAATGNLYGTTNQGGEGTCGCGVVFKLDTTGKETVLYTFTGGTDGGLPYAGVIRDAAGNLYGTTYDGGTGDQGVVFKLDTNGKETVLHAFTGKADGGFPFAGLLRDAEGNLYGTTYGGGDSGCFRPSPPSGGRSTRLDDLPPIPQGGCGVVFKLDSTGKETVLHTFTGADGNEPSAGLTRDLAGNLYGTTYVGGDLNCNGEPGYGCGVVFRLSPTRKLTVLHNFTGGAAGGFPDAGLIRDLAGNLYGTTLYGGDVNCNGLVSCGVVFKLDAAGKETVLYRFPGGADGSSPQAGLVQDAAGNLYGTAAFGGDLSCDPPNGCGVVFKLTP